MAQIVFDASPELARPGLFLKSAAGDLRSSLRVGLRLFSARLRGRGRRSLLGYVRMILPAIAVTIVCLYLKDLGILSAGSTPLPYPFYVLAGVLLWQIFVEAMNQPLQQLLAARHLIARSPVRHEAILIGAALDVLLSAAIRIALLVVVSWGFGAPIVPGPGLFVGIAGLILLGFAIGLWLSPLALLYDDVRDGLTMLTTIWFFLTPVAYRAPADGVLVLNPVTHLLDPARLAFAGEGVSGAVLLIAAVAALLLVMGWLVYRLARPHLVERLG